MRAMFGLWGKASNEARRVANEFLLYRDMLLQANSVDNLVNELRERKDEISYVDQEHKQCGWFGRESRMAYHADFDFYKGSKNILAEGKEKYYGLFISAGNNLGRVGVALQSLPIGVLGRKASSLHQKLIKFPQFWDLNDPMSAIKKW
jgi:hypothetical protein